MALITRRRFVQQTAFSAEALCGHPIKVLAGTRRIFEAREQNGMRDLDQATQRFAAKTFFDAT